MRRLTIEVPLRQTESFWYEEMLFFKQVKSIEFLHFLKQGKEEFAFICRVEFSDSALGIKDLSIPTWMKVRVLEEERKKGIFILLVSGKPPPQEFRSASSRPRGLGAIGTRVAGVYITRFQLTKATARATFVGDAKSIRSLLNDYGRRGISFKTVSLSDAKFSRDSLLGSLTDKQREVLVTAYKLGYYNLPRRISSDQVAKVLGLANSTFVVHRRKAERRLLSDILGEE